MRAVLAWLALVACCMVSAHADERAAPRRGGVAGDAPILNCADFADMTPARLAARFGQENIAQQNNPRIVVVASDDPRRSLVVVWGEDLLTLAAVATRAPRTRWVGPGNLTIGSPVSDVAHINVMPFRITWDEATHVFVVSGWNGGALSEQTPGCAMTMRLLPQNGDAAATLHDRTYQSDSAEVAGAALVVSGFGVDYTEDRPR